MDEILNLIESVSEGFPSYFCFCENRILTFSVFDIFDEQERRIELSGGH